METISEHSSNSSTRNCSRSSSTSSIPGKVEDKVKEKTGKLVNASSDEFDCMVEDIDDL